jgi:hypothetical protein
VLPVFVESLSRYAGVTAYSEAFLSDVADPMLWAFQRYKLKEYDGAMEVANQIAADDWRIAATEWLKRRVKNGR